MLISISGLTFIAAVSLIGLAFGSVVSKRVTDGYKLRCSPEIKKCNGNNQLYHLRSQQCLQNGRICGSNMVIMRLKTCRIQGECECDYENNERHLVYHDATYQCYPIYSQGPCDNGYVVFISAKNNSFKCERDTCLEEKSKVSMAERDSVVPYKNKCYTLSTTIDEPECTDQLKFIKNQLNPSCSPPIVQLRAISAFTSSTYCRPGSFEAFFGRCRPPSRFKFRHSFGVPSETEED